jgi:2,4-diaminopentanoate dehydrogenase
MRLPGTDIRKTDLIKGKTMNSIKAVLFGVGKAGNLIAKFMEEKGINIVGAFSRNSAVGVDIGNYFGLSKILGVNISNEPELTLPDLNADIAIFSTSSFVNNEAPLIKRCLENKINVISIAQEGFFPSSIECKKSLEELHEVVVNNGVSLYYGGMQETLLCRIPLSLTACCRNLNMIQGSCCFDLNPMGREMLKDYPLEMDAEEFAEHLRCGMSESDQKKHVATEAVAMEAFLNLLGLKVIQRTPDLIPFFNDKDFFSKTLGRTIKKDRTRGYKQTCDYVTDKGINAKTEVLLLLCKGDEDSYIQWVIDGDYPVSVKTNGFPGYDVTCACTVNQIPRVIEAKPGLLTAEKMSIPKFWHGMSGAD